MQDRYWCWACRNILVCQTDKCFKQPLTIQINPCIDPNNMYSDSITSEDFRRNYKKVLLIRRNRIINNYTQPKLKTGFIYPSECLLNTKFRFIYFIWTEISYFGKLSNRSKSACINNTVVEWFFILIKYRWIKKLYRDLFLFSFQYILIFLA